MNEYAQKFMQDSEGREGICSDAEAKAKELETPEWVVTARSLIHSH